MSCFLDTNVALDTDLQSFDAKQRQMHLVGSWDTEKDYKGLAFQVSKTIDDTVTVVFTGTSIYISGRINSKAGMEALFGIDDNGKEGGGILCSTSTQPSSSVLLYAESALPQGRHTLFITNQGSQLSLSGFQVIGVSTTSTSHPSTASPTTTTSLSSTTPPSNASSTFLTLPPPTPPGEGSSSQDGSRFRTETLVSTVNSPLSHTVSVYTTISILNGTTTTVVVASTVGTPQHPTSRKASPGAISGAVVGSVIFFSLLLGIALWWRRRHGNSLSFFFKGATSSYPEPEMATRLIPSAAPSLHRPESLAIPSVLEIAPGGAREHFHLDTQPGEAQSSPPASLPPSFRSHPDASPGLDGDLRRSGVVDVAVTNSQAVAILNTDSKTDSTPSESPATRSSPSSGPDEITELAPTAGPRRERSGWRARARARLWVEEDGSVRLAGGPVMDGRGEDDSGGWEVLPPPYSRRFR